MTTNSLPEPLAEAARDLLVICGALNAPSPAAQLLRPLGRTKAAQVSLAYSAVAEAVELAAGLQRDANRYGLDPVVGALAALTLRRVARELDAETDLWNSS